MSSPGTIPDTGSYGGTLESSPAVETPSGNAPDSNPSGNPDVSLSHKTLGDHLALDPAFRLDWHWAQAKTEKDAQQQDQKRLIDQSTLPTILDDQKKSQEHWDKVHGELINFMDGMKQSVPVRELSKPGWQEDIAAGLGMALGVRPQQAISGAMAPQEQRLAANYEQKLQQFGIDQNRAMMHIDQLQRDSDQAGADVRHFQDLELSERGHLADQAISERDKKQALDRQDAAEARQNQHLVSQELGDRYEAVERQVTQYGGVMDSKQLADLQATVDQINKEAKDAGISATYPPVHGGPTWKRQQDSDMNAYKKANMDKTLALLKATQEFRKTDQANRFAEWKLEHEFRVQQLGLDRSRVNLEALRATNDTYLKTWENKQLEAKGKLQSLSSQIQAAQLDRTMAGKKALNELFKKQQAAQTELGTAKFAIDEINKAKNQDENSGGQPGDGQGGGELQMAQSAIANHPEAAAKIKAAYTQRTGQPWPGG